MNPRLAGCVVLIAFLGITSFQQQQKCDTNQRVYENPSRSDMLVTMEFTDGCPDANSSVTAYYPGTPAKKSSEYTVPDGKTKIFHIDVPAGGSIQFDCRGSGHNNSGGCSFRLVSSTAE
jgi:hypothetical protein